jgi:hypothetical protein
MALLTEKNLLDLTQGFSERSITESFNQGCSRHFANGGKYDIFLSYSFNDILLAKKMFYLLTLEGFSVYADFFDASLDRKNVNEKTAKELVKKIKDCKCLIYLHTQAATLSKWCPWEIGLASGVNDMKCAILPVLKTYGSFDRQEYLLLYPYIDTPSVIANYNPDLYIHLNDSSYISLKSWIDMLY